MLGTQRTHVRDAAKFFTGNPPDDNALLAGLSDDPAQRQPTTLAHFDYLNRLAALESALRANGRWFFPHPWLITFVGDSQAESVVNTELGNLTLADLRQFGQVVLSPIRRPSISSPLLRLPSDSLCYAFNMVRIPTTNDANELNHLVEANKAIYRASQGRRRWGQHVGSAIGQLDAVKQEFDPA